MRIAAAQNTGKAFLLKIRGCDCVEGMILDRSKQRKTQSNAGKRPQLILKFIEWNMKIFNFQVKERRKM